MVKENFFHGLVDFDQNPIDVQRSSEAEAGLCGWILAIDG